MKKISLLVLALAVMLLSSCATPKKVVNFDEATLVYRSQTWDLIKIDENNFIAIPGVYATPGPVPFVISFDSVITEMYDDDDDYGEEDENEDCECECGEDEAEDEEDAEPAPPPEELNMVL